MKVEEAPPADRSLLRDYGATLVIAVGVAMAIRFFGIEAYRIPTPSMRPTLEAGDTIFVSKSAYGTHLPGSDRELISGAKPAYGDVVVYQESDAPAHDSLKRVIGLPGDTVEFMNGRLLLNGKSISNFDNPNSLCGTETLPGAHYGVCRPAPSLEDTGPQVVPEGSVFVAADSRTRVDSLAPLPYRMTASSTLKGKALWIWLSIQPSGKGGWFSRIRFERMFRRIK